MNEYKVVHLELAGRQLASLLALAKAQGRDDKVIDALRIIGQQLKTRPLDFGERRNFLRQLRLYTHDGGVAPLAVSYGVNDENRFVVITAFKLMGNAGPASSG